jgi:Leucine-rich repeat (LRR) protein
VRHNCLPALPDAAAGLSALTRLAAANNRLAELPPGLGSAAGLTAVRCLDLQRNSLRSLPASISGLWQLTQLQVQGNR